MVLRNAVHGSPLGEKNLKEMKGFYNWELPPFEFNQEIYQVFEKFLDKKKEKYNKWMSMFEKYQKEYPEKAYTLTVSKLNTGIE